MKVESNIHSGISASGGDSASDALSQDAQAANLLLILQQEILAGVLNSQQNGHVSSIQK